MFRSDGIDVDAFELWTMGGATPTRLVEVDEYVATSPVTTTGMGFTKVDLSVSVSFNGVYISLAKTWYSISIAYTMQVCVHCICMCVSVDVRPPRMATVKLPTGTV